MAIVLILFLLLNNILNEYNIITKKLLNLRHCFNHYIDSTNLYLLNDPQKSNLKLFLCFYT